MSMASDALLKTTAAKVDALEKMIVALNAKVDALALSVPIRSTISLRNKPDKTESRI